MSRARGNSNAVEPKNKEKEENPRYIITEGPGFIELTVDASAYHKRTKLHDDVDKIATELSNKIKYDHSHIKLSLYLDGLPIDDQIELQNKLLNIIEACIKDSKYQLTTLSLPRWKIVGTADEMKQNRSQLDINEHKERIARILGKVLARNTTTTELSLADGNFSKHDLDVFFANLDELRTKPLKPGEPISYTALTKLHIPGSTFKKEDLKDLKEKAENHKIELIWVAAKKPVPEMAEKDLRKTKKKKEISAPKNNSSQPSSVKDKAAVYINVPNRDNKALEVTPNIPSRSVSTYLPDTGLYSLAGIALGVPLGALAAIGGILAENFGATAILTILGVSLSASGIGLIVGGVILAGLVVGLIAYGIYQAEKKHQLKVDNALSQSIPPLIQPPVIPVSESAPVAIPQEAKKSEQRSGRLTPTSNPNRSDSPGSPVLFPPKPSSHSPTNVNKTTDITPAPASGAPGLNNSQSNNM